MVGGRVTTMAITTSASRARIPPGAPVQERLNQQQSPPAEKAAAMEPGHPAYRADVLLSLAETH